MFQNQPNGKSLKSQNGRNLLQQPQPVAIPVEENFDSTSRNSSNSDLEHRSSYPHSNLSNYADANAPYYCLTLYPTSDPSTHAPSPLQASPHTLAYPQPIGSSTVESPEYLAHRLLVEFGKTRTNYNSLVPRIVEVMRLYRDYGPSRCPVPVVSNLEELLNDEALNRIEHRYPNSLDAGFLVLCTERRALRSGGGGKYYFIDTSGRLVGCHKSDLSNHADKGILCGPVLLKNLIFVFIMRGSFGLDPRCKSSNPQRLLEYYENLAKEGKAMDVQRLVRVWSMEIFPEAPYDGGFPHCSLLWVKRMHVGAHLVKWKRSQWHSNQLRVQDYYVQTTSQPPSGHTTTSPVPQQIPLNQQMCDYYNAFGGNNTLEKLPRQQITNQDFSEIKEIYPCSYQKSSNLKRRRVSEEPTYYSASDPNFPATNATQHCVNNHERYSASSASTIHESDSLYPDSFVTYTDSIPSTPCNLSSSLVNLNRSPGRRNAVLRSDTLPPTPQQTVNSNTPSFSDKNTVDIWSLPFDSDLSSASRSMTPQMPTILTSSFSNADEFYPASFSTAASVPLDYKRSAVSRKDADAFSQLSDERIYSFSFSSELQNLQAIYMNFNQVFVNYKLQQLQEISHQTIARLNDSSTTSALQLLLLQDPNEDLRNSSHCRAKLTKQVCEYRSIDDSRNLFKILLGCFLQQRKLETSGCANTDRNFEQSFAESSKKFSYEVGPWDVSNETSNQQSDKDPGSVDNCQRLIPPETNSWQPSSSHSDSNEKAKFSFSSEQEYYRRSLDAPSAPLKNDINPYFDSNLPSPQCISATPYPMRPCGGDVNAFEESLVDSCILDRNLYAQTFADTALSRDKSQTFFLESDQPITTYQAQPGYFCQEDQASLSMNLGDYCDKIFQHMASSSELSPSQIRPLSHSARPTAQGLTLLEQIQHITSYEEATTPQFYRSKSPYNLETRTSNDTGKECLYSGVKSEDVCDDVDVRQGQNASSSESLGGELNEQAGTFKLPRDYSRDRKD